MKKGTKQLRVLLFHSKSEACLPKQWLVLRWQAHAGMPQGNTDDNENKDKLNVIPCHKASKPEYPFA